MIFYLPRDENWPEASVDRDTRLAGTTFPHVNTLLRGNFVPG
jgi:hypothetical protein